jgi:hypothetical protein
VVITGAPAYDSSEDTYVGVVNNYAGTLQSLTLTGSDIFGFDSDGIQTYGSPVTGTTGYEGPGTSFTITNNNLGVVNFTGGSGLGSGQQAYFSLEEAPTVSGLGVQSITTVPDGGSTLAMFGATVCALGALRRRFAFGR